MASSINRQLSGSITRILPLRISCTDAKAEEPIRSRELPHSCVDPVSRSSWSMKRGQTGSSSLSSLSSSSSVDRCTPNRSARRSDKPGSVTSRASVPLNDSAAFIHGLERLPGTGAFVFRVREPAAGRTGTRRPKKGCNTIESGDGEMENETRKGTRENGGMGGGVLGERVIG